MRGIGIPGDRRPVTVLGRLIDLALIALVSVSLSGVVLGRILPLLGYPVYVVAGPSMEPAIAIGAAVVLEVVPEDALGVGDVVSLRSGAGKAIFTHRIVRTAERDGAVWIETQGDANTAPDPSISPASAVIGRVAWSLPVAGYLIALLSMLPGLVLVLSTGALLLIAGWWLEGLAAVPHRRPAGPPAAADQTTARGPQRAVQARRTRRTVPAASGRAR